MVEFCVGYALILAAIWTLNPWQRWFYWIAVTWVVVTTWMGRPTWKDLGLGLPGLVRSLWVVGVAAILTGVAVYTASRLHSLHRLHGPTPLIPHIWGYLVWAVMQQFLLQIYFLLRLMRLLPGKVAPVLAAAGLFSLAHLPNPVLAPGHAGVGSRRLHSVLALSEYLYPGPRPRHPRALCRSGCARFHPAPHAGRDRLLSLSSSSQPDSPDRIHRRMGDGGRSDPALLTPRQAIKDAGESRQQDIAPIEDRGALVEVGETKQGRGNEQAPRRPNPPLQKILHPATKEKFFRYGNKEEREQPREQARQTEGMRAWKWRKPRNSPIVTAIGV